MMKSPLDQELSMLSRELLVMGTLCEEALTMTSLALHSGDREQKARVKALEESIDQKERTIETSCLRLLLRQQPVARDLRQISATLKMITDLERIGDQAADISEILLQRDTPFCETHDLVAEMADAATRMVTGGVEAFVRQDTALAEAVIAGDDELDMLFEQIKKRLTLRIAAAPNEGGEAVDLLMIAKYLERIGDHAVNVAEWAMFSVTGVHGGETEL